MIELNHYPLFPAGRDATRVPRLAGACDCHLHVYDSRFPSMPGAVLNPPDASLADYRLIQKRIGTERAVLVTPSTYGADNSVMLAGLCQLDENGRGVAVIRGDEPDSELTRLAGLGVRGVRINLSLGKINTVNSVEPIAERIAAYGWHLQLLAPLDILCSMESTLNSLPVPVVLDHFARLRPEHLGVHPACSMLMRLLSAGNTWVKLSGGYLVSALASTDDPALDPLARALIDAAPERILWGSDWPHASASAGHQPMPDDASQMDRLAHWAASSERLRAILVSNPSSLYGFAPLAGVQ